MDKYKCQEFITSFGLKTTRFIQNAYLYKGECSNEYYYILISPAYGSIEIFKTGDGNYIDLYFKMKYGND